MANTMIARITPELFRTKRGAKAWSVMLDAVARLETALANDRAATVDAIRIGLTARWSASLGRQDIAQELAVRYEDALEQAHRAASEAQERRNTRKLQRTLAKGNGAAKAAKKGKVVPEATPV